MSYVDMMGNQRWTGDMHRSKSEAEVRRLQVSHDAEHILLRRSVSMLMAILGQVLPEGPLRQQLQQFGRMPTPEALLEIAQAAAAFDAAEALADAGRADAAVLHRVLDHEQGIATLAEDDTAGLELLALRAAARGPVEPQLEPPPQDPPPDEPPAEGGPL